jgi:Arc/MetJ-type ribon-helix-helix transcriptional regulator
MTKTEAIAKELELPEPMTVKSFKLPKRMIQEIKEMAEECNASEAAVVRAALRLFLKKHNYYD